MPCQQLGSSLFPSEGWSPATRLQATSRHIAIIERKPPRPDQLPGLMPTTGNQHTIACLGGGKCNLDRTRPVEFDARIAGVGNSLQNIPGDLHRIFAGRVTVGNNELIGPFGHCRPKMGAKVPIPLSRGAEDTNQLPASRLAQCLQRGAHRRRRVPTIDKQRKGLPAFDPLEMSRHPIDPLDSTDDRLQLDSIGQSHGGRREAIINMVVSDHVRSDRNGLVTPMD